MNPVHTIPPYFCSIQLMTQAVSRRSLTAEAPGLYPGQSMWNLWWTKWHWDRFYSEFFSYSRSISFHCGSPYSYITCGMNNRTTGGHSSETQSHPINMNIKKHPSMLRSYKWSVLFRFLNCNFVCIFHLYHACYNAHIQGTWQYQCSTRMKQFVTKDYSIPDNLRVLLDT
jgi:hypothetical protein